MRKRSYKGESDESAKRSRAGHKAWLTQRKRYTDQGDQRQAISGCS